MSEWVKAWLRPGDELAAGGEVPAQRFGVRLDSDVELVGTGEELAELGDALAVRYYSPRTEAVDAFAEAIAGIYPEEGIGFQSFTCSEANALARMLVVFGHYDTAVNVVAGHCLDDDCGDQHGYIHDLHNDEGQQARDEAAAVFVRRLAGDRDAQPDDYEQRAARLAELRAAVADAATPQETAERARDLIVRLRQELGESLNDIDAEQG